MKNNHNKKQKLMIKKCVNHVTGISNCVTLNPVKKCKFQ